MQNPSRPAAPEFSPTFPMSPINGRKVKPPPPLYNAPKAPVPLIVLTEDVHSTHLVERLVRFGFKIVETYGEQGKPLDPSFIELLPVAVRLTVVKSVVLFYSPRKGLCAHSATQVPGKWCSPQLKDRSFLPLLPLEQRESLRKGVF